MSEDARQMTEGSKERQFPATADAAQQELDALEAEKKRIESRIKHLKKFVQNEVDIQELKQKEDGSKYGYGVKGDVLHTMFERASTKYSEVLKQAKSELIPKTKHERLDEIIKENTTFSEVHKTRFMSEDEKLEHFG